MLGIGLLVGCLIGGAVMAVLMEGAMVKDLWKTLDGKKTYILMIIGIVTIGGEQVGLFPAGTVDFVEKVIVALGLGTIRSAIKKQQ